MGCKWGYLLAFVCACSADPGGEQGPLVRSSGTRLRAAYWDGAGVRVPMSWFDSQLGTECDFQKDAAGMYRCFPVTHSYDSLMYRDAACSDVVATIREGCPLALPAGYVRSFGSGCDGIGEVRQIGERLPAGTPLYARDSSNVCIPQTTTVPAYALGPKLSESNFVIAIEEVGSGVRLAPIFLHAEDGAREWVGIQDTQLGFRCGAGLAADGTTRCLPWDRTMLYTFRDAQCTQGVLERGVCGTSSFVYKEAAPNCGGLRIFKVGASVPVPTLYDDFGQCVSQGPPSAGRQFVAVGDEIPAEMMAPMSEDELGDGRIRERIWRGPDGNIVSRAAGWIDTDLGVEVYEQAYAPAQWALIPAPVYGGFVFGDSACMHPIGEWHVDACAMTIPPLVVETFASSPNEVCPTRPFNRVGPQVMPQTVSFGNAMHCNPQSPPTDQEFFELGDPVDPASIFVLLRPTHG
jgi:hypothetical protein